MKFGIGPSIDARFVVQGVSDILCGIGDIVRGSLNSPRGGAEALLGTRDTLRGCLPPSHGTADIVHAIGDALRGCTKNPLDITDVLHPLGDVVDLGGTNPLLLEGTPLSYAVLLPCIDVEKPGGTLSSSLGST
jgi:hypothetical protein